MRNLKTQTPVILKSLNSDLEVFVDLKGLIKIDCDDDLKQDGNQKSDVNRKDTSFEEMGSLERLRAMRQTRNIERTDSIEKSNDPPGFEQ